jgi:hypothetical protein
MKHLHLFEIMDQDWCPNVVRQALTDYLQFVSWGYGPTVPILAAALRRTGARRILDLGSGSAGPWSWLQPALGLKQASGEWKAAGSEFFCGPEVFRL